MHHGVGYHVPYLMFGIYYGVPASASWFGIMVFLNYGKRLTGKGYKTSHLAEVGWLVTGWFLRDMAEGGSAMRGLWGKITWFMNWCPGYSAFLSIFEPLGEGRREKTGKTLSLHPGQLVEPMTYPGDATGKDPYHYLQCCQQDKTHGHFRDRGSYFRRERRMAGIAAMEAVWN